MNKHTILVNCSQPPTTYSYWWFVYLQTKGENDMQKLLTTTCLLASCASMAYGANYTTNPKTDSPVRVFVGGNIDMNINSWSTDAKNTMDDIGVTLPSNNLALGAEVGVKFFSYAKMYNLGISAEYNYMFDSGATINAPASEYIDEITVGFSSLGFNMENYFRVSNEDNKRVDLIIGVGYAQITERVSTQIAGYINDLSDKGSSIALIFGAEGQINDYISWTVKPKVYLMTATKNSDLSAMFDINAGIRFTF